MTAALKPENVAQLIFFVAGRKRSCDADLAKLYGVKPPSHNEQLRRNRERFPEDFAFSLPAMRGGRFEACRNGDLKFTWWPPVHSRLMPSPKRSASCHALYAVLRSASGRSQHRDHAHLRAASPFDGYNRDSLGKPGRLKQAREKYDEQFAVEMLEAR